MFRTARRLKGHQQQQPSAQLGNSNLRLSSETATLGSARKQQPSAQLGNSNPRLSSETAATAAATSAATSAPGHEWWSDGGHSKFFVPVFFGVLLSGGVLGAMGAAPGSICPRFFLHVRRSAGGSRIRPDLPLFFFFFLPRQEECWREPHQARFALVFFPFFHVRRSAGGRTRPDLPSSTSGGVLGAAPGPICPRFFPFFPTSGGVGRRRQLCRVGGPSGDCSLSSWGHHMHFVARTHGEAPGGCLIGLLFFQAFASSRHLKATFEDQEGEELQLLEGETRCCR